jgi:hypothetical protein
MAGIISKKGCGYGCGAVVLVGLIAIITTTMTMNHQYQAAADDRRALDEEFGARADFDPGTGAVIPTDRLEVFLQVRTSLMGEFHKLEGANEMMRGAAGDSGAAAPAQNPMARFFSTTFGGVNQLVHLGSFASDRNRALRENGMGFGEYTWIYALAYYGYLGQDPVLGAGANEAGFIPAQARKDLAGMMRRRAETNPTEAALWRADADPLELMWLKPFGLGYEDR